MPEDCCAMNSHVRGNEYAESHLAALAMAETRSLAHKGLGFMVHEGSRDSVTGPLN